MKNIARPAIALTLWFFVLTGLAFPFAIFGIAQTAFPFQANGSLIADGHGRVVGSQLIGQQFSKPGYVHPRPSAAGSGYDAANSGATNLGPTSAKLFNGLADDPKTKDTDESFAGVKQLAEAYRKENGLGSDAVVPVDAVTRSASGLDPDISLENALIQCPRIAASRRLPVERIKAAVASVSMGRFAGIYGEPRVNVLQLNLLLDRIGQE